MQSYFDTVTNQGGAPIPGASVFVYDSLGALATLFSDNGVTPQSNPIVTGADGKFIFFAANGIYSAVITAPSYNSVTITGITLNDPAPAPTFTGTGAYVLQTSPTLVTPDIGTPSAAVLTNATGLPVSGVTGLGTNVATALAVTVGSVGAVVVNGGALGTPSSGTLTNATGLPIDGGTTGTLPAGRGGTGLTALGAGVATFLATPSSANLAAAVTGETGTGALVFATSPTLVTPTIGVATATSINGVTINRGLNDNNESVAIGQNALDATTSGDFNVAVGDRAGTDITSGTNNSLLGRLAGGDITSGSQNVAVGREAARLLTTGSDNVAIGREAAKDLTTGTKNIHIGLESQASSNSVEKEIVIAIQKQGKGDDTAFIGGSNGVYNEDNTTAWQTTSDERIKRDIVDAAGGLSIIDAVRVRNYRYKTAAEMPLDDNGRPMASGLDPDKLRIGFIAQELEQVLPESVTVQSSGVRSVNIDALHYHLILAVQQLSRRVAELEAR